ncbi:MAG: VOC family protein [Gammaproteobacteria bacterium]|nr:VOC family protein [Gammaproteobacteria bacterium]
MISIPILTLDHMGIRVSELDLSLEFYSIFGFELDASEDLTDYQVYPLSHPSGVRINLILNAEQNQKYNVLLDADIKYSGITHLAFVVKNMQDTLQRLKENQIVITEGPVQVSPRRIVCFIRDPDGNVLEFNELSHYNNVLF